MTKPIIVGVDGSASARAAAELAAESAERRRLDLELLHAFVWPLIYPPLLTEPHERPILPRARARALLDTAASAVTLHHPRLPVRRTLVDGHAAGVLVDASRRASFLFVGHRGVGGFTELLTGSVGINVTTHGYCPVVVMRGDAGGAGAPVLVGVDGSPGARSAARVAFEEARVRAVDLVVVLAWPPARVWHKAAAAAGVPLGTSGFDPLAVSLAGTVEDFPDVKMSTEVRHGPTPPELLANRAAEIGAGLLVVGSRGVGGFRGLLMGSTSRALVDHAPCPVMIVPKPATQGGE
jgi:nucleotide-binding universal stress UspA family protein